MSSSAVSSSLPTDPVRFKGELSYQYIEEDSGRAPACYHDKVCYIPLASELCDDDDASVAIRMHGKQSVYQSECLNLRLNGHNYGMLFCVRAQNEAMKNKVIWRRSVSRATLKELMLEDNTSVIDGKTIHLQGDAPEVPNCIPSTVILRLKQTCRLYWTVESVELRQSLEAYNQFICRYQD